MPQRGPRRANLAAAVARGTLRQRDADERVRRHATEGMDPKPFLEEPIQHTPGEGALCASPCNASAAPRPGSRPGP